MILVGAMVACWFGQYDVAFLGNRIQHAEWQSDGGCHSARSIVAHSKTIAISSAAENGR
jgi:hypothetical protein